MRVGGGRAKRAGGLEEIGMMYGKTAERERMGKE